MILECNRMSPLDIHFEAEEKELEEIRARGNRSPKEKQCISVPGGKRINPQSVDMTVKPGRLEGVDNKLWARLLGPKSKQASSVEAFITTGVLSVFQDDGTPWIPKAAKKANA